MKTLHAAFLCCSAYLLLLSGACSSKYPRQEFTKSVDSSAQPTSYYQITSQPTPSTYEILYDSSAQTTDGTLVLSISSEGTGCYKLGDPIHIRLIFTNLSDTSLILQSRFAISPRETAPGDLAILPKTADGGRLYKQDDFVLVDTFLHQPTDFTVIQPHDRFEATIEYFFPSDVLYKGTENTGFSPTRSGSYFIKIIYQNDTAWSGSWVGEIGSNQIPICIQ